MESHTELSYSELLSQFEECSLVPSLFSPQAHLGLAWLLIHQYGAEEAEKCIQKLLKAYVNAFGSQDKYNTALTVGALKAENHFISRDKFKHFQAFISTYPRLKNDFKGLMASPYGFDIFNSSKAKRSFLEPDLLPFD
jgi:hypothetical protein